MTHRPIRKISFLHIVPFERDDPARGLQEALALFEEAEELGLDGGWIRTRHVQYGVSSAAVFLTAAAARTRRLELGTAVIPTFYESPLRLAEDLATADLLSGGRLQPGLSVGPPRLPDETSERLFGPRWREEDAGYTRIERVLGFIRGEAIGDEHQIGSGGREVSSDRVEPHSPGLAERLWYGGGSLRSAEWAGRAGLRLLVSNQTTIEPGDTFETAQRRQIDRFRAAHPRGEQATVAQGRVLVPTDDTTPEQRRRFTEYVAARTPRTLAPRANGHLAARDVLGSTEEIVAQLRADVAHRAADELLVELPFQLGHDDVRHILRQLATRIGPALGWRPRAGGPAR